MLADRLELGDSVGIRLECDHKYTGGEMKCLRCGEYKNASQNITLQVEVGDIQFTDS